MNSIVVFVLYVIIAVLMITQLIYSFISMRKADKEMMHNTKLLNESLTMQLEEMRKTSENKEEK